METRRTQPSPSLTRKHSMIAMSSVSLQNRIFVELVLDWRAGIATLSSAQPLLPSLPVPLIRSEWEPFLRHRSTLLAHMLVVLLVSSVTIILCACTFPIMCLGCDDNPPILIFNESKGHVLLFSRIQLF